MPKIEYDIQCKKIKRKYTPEWKKSGNVDLDDVLPKYLSSVLKQNQVMVEYIEMLHDEIDRLQEHIARQQTNK